MQVQTIFKYYLECDLWVTSTIWTQGSHVIIVKLDWLENIMHCWLSWPFSRSDYILFSTSVLKNVQWKQVLDWFYSVFRHHKIVAVLDLYPLNLDCHLRRWLRRFVYCRVSWIDICSLRFPAICLCFNLWSYKGENHCDMKPSFDISFNSWSSLTLGYG